MEKEKKHYFPIFLECHRSILPDGKKTCKSRFLVKMNEVLTIFHRTLLESILIHEKRPVISTFLVKMNEEITIDHRYF